ncbi:MAG: ABC transporter ATP-binding protein, partial [Ruthenibacterium sp.]
LGAALAAYEGTLILVTHDRYLMNSLACPILYLEDGKATQYASYDAMQHRKDAPQSKAPQPENSAPKAASYGKEQRRRKAELRTKIKELEDEMETLSLRCIDLEAEINDPETLRDHMRLRETCDALDDAKFRQEEAFNEWETLIEEQDALTEDAPAEE